MALGFLIGSGVGLLVLLASMFSVMQMAENRSIDLRFRLFPEPELHSPDISLIVVDDPSLRRMEQETEIGGRWPFTRDVFAALIDFLTVGGARVIVFDVMFVEEDRLHPERDEMLVESTRDAGNIYYAALIHTEPGSVPPLSDRARAALGEKMISAIPSGRVFKAQVAAQGTTLPLVSLMEASRGIGAINFWPDADGVARGTPLLYRYGASWIPSLPLSVARDLAPTGEFQAIKWNENGLQLGGQNLWLDNNDRLLIHWYGGVGTYPYYPIRDLLLSYSQISQGDEPIVSPEIFRDKIVLIGVTASGIGELKVTPFSPLYPGVEIMATLIDNIRQGHFLRETPWFLVVVLVLGLPVFCSLIVLAFPKISFNLPMVSLMALGYGALIVVTFQEDIVIPVVAPLGGLALAYTIGISVNYIFEGRQRQKLSRYFSPQVIREILSDPRHMETGKGARKELTVLFSDIRGFTTLSEKMEPQKLTAHLSEYFSEMVSVIFKHKGSLDKYVGDAVMAFWGAPLDDPHHARNAVLAALEMLERLEALNARWRVEGKPEFKIGIGINTGEMVIGNVGAPQQVNYTVIGDNVNLAARLEGVNKEFGTQILLSESSCKAVGDMIETRYVSEVKVKGRSGAVKIYEPMGIKDARI